MTQVLLKKMYREIKEVKTELHRLIHTIEEDFELSEAIKTELERARKEPITSYINHDKVLKEFA